MACYRYLYRTISEVNYTEEDVLHLLYMYYNEIEETEKLKKDIDRMRR